MATYSKRGYKTPKEKEVTEVVDTTHDQVEVLEKDSTTAGVFSALDDTASKTEDFIAKNQNSIIGIIGAIALVLVSYLAYQKFVVAPKEDEAANALFQAQQHFQQAIDGVASDSLFKLSLKGAAGKNGLLYIADEYSGTDAGNLANYYTGIAYLNTGKYNDAIAYLEKFKSDDQVLSALALGAIGDAYSQNKQPSEALEYYIKAIEINKNDFTTPRFLLKAGKVALQTGNKEDALTYFTDIKENFESAPEAASVDVLIGLSQ